MQRHTFDLESIHCENCERAIRQHLGSVDGVSQVHPDARSNTTQVVFDPELVSEADLIEAFREAGFPVVDAGADAQGAAGGSGRYALLVAGVLTVAVAGYLGYVLYPRFDLPAVEGVAVLGLAAAAGVAAFFSPCSFPLLLGILGREATARADQQRPAAARPVVFGAALAAGAGTFLLLAGLAIAAGGGALFEQVTFASTAGIAIRATVGVVLVGLGLIQLGVLPTPFHAVERAVRPLVRRQARLRRQRPVIGFAAFGFGYVLAGFG